MFRSKEKQSLINARARALTNAENRIVLLKSQVENRNKLIKNYQEEHEILLQNERVKTEILNRIVALVERNQCNNEKMTIRQIKELIHDYQSKN